VSVVLGACEIGLYTRDLVSFLLIC
jgi:hypothetical protein